ncbi:MULTISPECIES: hypothetical protein [Cupriavidus]
MSGAAAGRAEDSQLRRALAWLTDMPERIYDATADTGAWVWEAIQGDFNEHRTVGQVAFDTVISMIPLVDQICDVRDLIANSRQINKDPANHGAWVAIGLTLIGLFPSLGSLLKGVLKIFFLYIRRYGLDHVAKAVNEAMHAVIIYLRKPQVQKAIRVLLPRGQRLFPYLAQKVRETRDLVSKEALLNAFDRGIDVAQSLRKYAIGTKAGAFAEAAIRLLMGVRREADKRIGKAVMPLRRILEDIIRRLELEDLLQRRGIMDTTNVHFYGGLPTPRAVTLMRTAEPPPSWLRKGRPTENAPLIPKRYRLTVDKEAKKDYLKMSDKEIASFASLVAFELKGPARLYRVIGPGSFATSRDWMTAEAFEALRRAGDPKAAWRQNYAVWPNWNPDGQFVVYDVKVGETLKVWRGRAAYQELEELPGHFLEGGWEQLKFDASALRNAEGAAIGKAGDDAIYLRVDRETGKTQPAPGMDYERYKNLPEKEKENYEFVRTKINHPAISGPFDTGWGMTDFEPSLLPARLGLPSLEGQISQIKP